MSAPNNTIRWFVKASFDEPKLRSPQPCQRGAHCDYKRWNPESKQMEPAVCHFVHPGEEGTGRRLFPARELEGGLRQPACVRLTGAAQGFYERCGKKIPWGTWCAQKGIPYTPVTPGTAWEPVTIARIGGKAVPRAPQRPRAEQPQTPQRPRAEQPPPMAPKRSSSAGGGGGATLSIEEWAATATEEELEDYRRHCEDTGPDCNYCDPRSGCDGDHGDEMRDGFIVRKRVPATPQTKPTFTLGLGGPTCTPGCACIWGERKCSDRLSDEESLLAYAQQTAAVAAEVNNLEKPDADGRIWYDSRTPVGALAQALIACEKLEATWHPSLKPLVDASTPEELATELGPADLANIQNSPWHYATHLVGRAQRIQAAKPQNLDGLLSAVANAETHEELDQVEKELEAAMDK